MVRFYMKNALVARKNQEIENKTHPLSKKTILFEHLESIDRLRESKLPARPYFVNCCAILKRLEHIPIARKIPNTLIAHEIRSRKLAASAAKSQMVRVDIRNALAARKIQEIKR